MVLVDYKKAFDHLDQNIIIRKLSRLGIPSFITEWISSFLHHRVQWVKIDNESHSDWAEICGGVPQGTKLGPLLFLVMINDLQPRDIINVKFVDDTSLVETTTVDNISPLPQQGMDHLSSWSNDNSMIVHPVKTKEMRFCFSK